MIPTTNGDLQFEFDELQIPSGSWRLTDNMTRVRGKIFGIEDVKQSVYFILNTEQNEYFIYNWDYGIQLKDLFGEDIEYVMAELENRIKEALMYDDRIVDVTDFEFEQTRNKLHVTFKVVTEIDEFESDMEVTV